MSRENLEDTVEYTQQMLQDILEMLGQAWDEVDRLKQALLNSPASTHPSPSEPPAAGQLNGVLIIDDSKVLQLRIKSILQSLNYEVVGVAEDGVSGVKLALQKLPQLMVVDYQMPEMDGLEVLVRIKKMHPNIKVLICAGTITPSLTAMLLKAGADQIIAKPIQLNTFVEAVRSCMS